MMLEMETGMVIAWGSGTMVALGLEIVDAMGRVDLRRSSRVVVGEHEY